jgi:mannose-1-phosphate guanylyltransferase
MEGAGRVAVVPAAGLGWSDVGSWDSLFDLLAGDPQGNIVMGKRYIGIDTSDSLIHISDNHRLVVTIGVKDLVVVDTGDVLLVCDRDQAQMIKQIVGLLKEEGQDYI